jgi:organic radical activating enzyme
MCLAKWQMLTLYLNTGRNHSCYHPIRHQIPLDELAANPGALHNTSYKKNVRKQMLEGKRPKECDYCWTMEDLGQLSDRAIHSGTSCEITDLAKIAALPWDSDDVKPTQLEVSFSSSCNLKCSYCTPDVSSKWYEEIVEHGGYPTSSNFNGHVDPKHPPYILEREQNPYVDAFWKWLPTIIDDLKVLRVTGGEPLMTKHTFELMNNLSHVSNPKLQFAVNSNLSVPDALIDKYIKHANRLCGKVGHQRMFTSLDAVGPQAEYQRFGLDYDRLLKNVHRVMRETESVDISFMVTFNILSITSFTGFLQLILDLRAEYGQRINFDLPFLRYPQHQSISMLPASYVSYFDGFLDFMRINSDARIGLDGFQKLEIEKMGRLRAYVLAGCDPKDRDNRIRDFHLFFKEHDRRRKTDFLATFPELEELYREGERRLGKIP